MQPPPDIDAQARIRLSDDPTPQELRWLRAIAVESTSRLFTGETIEKREFIDTADFFIEYILNGVKS